MFKRCSETGRGDFESGLRGFEEHGTGDHWSGETSCFINPLSSDGILSQLFYLVITAKTKSRKELMNSRKKLNVEQSYGS
jgi:hypothetical protein